MLSLLEFPALGEGLLAATTSYQSGSGGIAAAAVLLKQGYAGGKSEPPSLTSLAKPTKTPQLTSSTLEVESKRCEEKKSRILLT